MIEITKIKICPYCKNEYNHLGKHYPYCNIKDHYKIINFGNNSCIHDLKANFNGLFKQQEDCDIVIDIKCSKCELHLIFDTFERIWLPNLDTIKVLEKLT